MLIKQPVPMCHGLPVGHPATGLPLFRALDSDRGRESVLLPLPPNRTGGSPAYGSPVGGFTWLRIDELPHQRKENPIDKQRSVYCPFLPMGRQHA